MITVGVVGSVNVDLVVEVPNLPAVGATVLGSDLQVLPGGKGANQAVAAARLGAQVAMIGATGDDDFGARVRATLAGEGLDTTHVATVPGVPTGTALVMVDAEGHNMISVAPGANARLDASHLDAVRQLRTDVVLLQMEIPLPTCLAVARLARRAGARVVLNAAPLDDPDDPDVAALLSDVDVLVVNEGEAGQLVGHPPPNDPDQWEKYADALRLLGPDVVVVTLGERGAVAHDGDLHIQDAYDVTAIDTTGAGDAFCGALAVRLAHADPVPDAVRVACAAGALATTRMGAQAAMPTQADIDHLVSRPRPDRAHWISAYGRTPDQARPTASSP